MARIFLSPPDVGATERVLLLAAFDSNWIAPVGPDLTAFENEFAALVDMPHAVAVSSGTAALHLTMQTLGIGAGQTNRVGSAKLALEAAGGGARGAVLASDGFFPFADTIRLAASHGISAVIQPGGSVRDGDSIQACNELGLAMLTTGRRHFLH